MSSAPPENKGRGKRQNRPESTSNAPDHGPSSANDDKKRASSSDAAPPKQERASAATAVEGAKKTDYKAFSSSATASASSSGTSSVHEQNGKNPVEKKLGTKSSSQNPASHKGRSRKTDREQWEHDGDWEASWGGEEEWKDGNVVSSSKKKEKSSGGGAGRKHSKNWDGGGSWDEWEAGGDWSTSWVKSSSSSQKKSPSSPEDEEKIKEKMLKFQGAHPGDKRDSATDGTRGTDGAGAKKAAGAEQDAVGHAGSSDVARKTSADMGGAKKVKDIVEFKPSARMQPEERQEVIAKRDKIRSERLPIDDQKEKIQERINSDTVLIIRGDTGTFLGKMFSTKHFWNRFFVRFHTTSSDLIQ